MRSEAPKGDQPDDDSINMEPSMDEDMEDDSI